MAIVERTRKKQAQSDQTRCYRLREKGKRMRQFHPKSYLVMLCLLLATTACRPSEASSTLQPGAVEVPFETVVLDDRRSH